MKEGLEAFNALVDVVLAYRPKQKSKSSKRAKPRKRPQPRKGSKKHG
jgi:hypothetical protein